MRRWGFAWVLAGCCACGPNSVSGTVRGAPLTLRDVFFTPVKDADGKTVGFNLVLSDQDALCEAFQAGREPPRMSALTFVLDRRDGERRALPPDEGDYPVRPALDPSAEGRRAVAAFAKTDARCADLLPAEDAVARDGELKITSLAGETGGTMAGTFELSIGVQSDEVRGAFEASYCELSQAPAEGRTCE